jgi:peptidoglycan/xylan/chitin deacetylase (PgdA/CDA1 family)
MNFILENVLKTLISSSKQRVVLPFYHKVSDEEQTFSKYLYVPRKVLDFKKDLDVLCKYYNPISMQEFMGISKQKDPLKKNYFHITFDDGLSNFYNIAAPILLEKNIPATVFVNSNFLDNKALFFRCKASLLYQYYQKASLKDKIKFHDFFDGKTAIKEKLFAINFNNKEVLDDLAASVNYSFDEYLQTEKPYLTSAQVQELIEMGFTIGAHSKSHPLYSDINLEAQINQTKECIDWLVKKFHLEYKVFSFPFTDLHVSKAFFTLLRQEKIIDISFGTAGVKKDNFKTNFQRLVFEIENQSAENYLLKEYFKYFLKIPFNKNTMPRN